MDALRIPVDSRHDRYVKGSPPRFRGAQIHVTPARLVTHGAFIIISYDVANII
jgi:hypothetical protein